MALPAPFLPNVSRIVCHYASAVGGVTAVNVFHVLSNGANALDVFNRFSTSWQAAQMAHTTLTVSMTSIDVTRLDNLSATESFVPTGSKFSGSQTGEFNPAVALLVHYTTGFRGLASDGHTYAPCVAEALATNGTIDVSGVGGIQEAWVAFVNTLTTQTIPLQIVSHGREATPTLPAAPATNHTVTAVAVDTVLSTIRGRQSRLRG